MPNNLEITLPSNWEALWPQIIESAKRFGFLLDRQGNNINVSGPKIAGQIEVAGNRGQLKIERKPFFVSNNMIVNKIQEFLRNFM